MRSKEDTLLELIFNTPKHWHFEELRLEAKIGRPQLARWLKKFEKEGIVKRIKEEGKMPYYLQDVENPQFRNRKRLFGWRKLTESGLFDYLASLQKARVVILFGSFSRWDWYKNSDIDIFIYENEGGEDLGRFQFKLHREIQLFSAKNSNELEKFRPGLISNIIRGIVIKGTLPQEMINHAYIEE